MDVAKARVRKGRLILFMALPLLTAACNESAPVQTATFPETTASCAATAVSNRFIIQWKDGTHSVVESNDRETFIRDYLEPLGDEVDFAENDQVVVPPAPSPGDTVMAAAIEAPNWGQTIVGASDAWAKGVTGEGVIVAVVDSGAEVTHPQLATRLAVNPGEIPANGVDDDQNGFIDDVNGYDFDSGSANVTDDAGHGTHVSGIIVADHSTGSVRGMAPGAKLLPLRFMNKDGSGNISAAISAMNYAVSRGAKIINASWGGNSCSKTLQKAILSVGAKGVLFVAAAGNNGVDIDQYPEYPAAYGLSNQLTVGASTARDYMAGFTNFSVHLVQLMAPGQSILSTYPGGQTQTLSGTSMAAPFVSGAAALLWSHRPAATVAQIRQVILNSVDSGNFAVSTSGRLNVSKALAELEKLVP
jgi:subtilisin family serine protease